MTVISPFSKKVRDFPLTRSYRLNTDMKFDGSTDPVEYLSHFSTEMQVYQVEEPTRCRLLAATLVGNAYKWFKRLAAGSIRSWTQIGDLFVSQFKALIAYASPVNTLANIKQKDNEILKEYFKRFNDQVSRVSRLPWKHSKISS